MKKNSGFMSALLTAISLVGCATTVPEPVQQLALAEATIKDARDAGALEAAPAEQNSAEENLKLAMAAIKDEDNEMATWYSEKAIVDAEFAEVKAQNAEAKDNLKQLQDGNTVLKNELNRSVR